MNPYSAELCHHGILGQRWGKRNGPPYPLDAGDHSASEKKAGWRKSVKSMSDDELRQKINRKRMENDYKYYSSKVGKSRDVNDALDVAKKGFRTAGNLASTASKGLQLSNKSKVDNIDDDDRLTKRQKRELKKELRRGETIANAASQGSHAVANELQKTKRVSTKTDLSKMSDKELREKVNRLMLEAQYEDAYHVNKGKEYTEMVLDSIGAVASIATTAIGIATLIQQVGNKTPKVGAASKVKFG